MLGEGAQEARAQGDPELLKLLRDQTTQELDTDIKKESDAAAEPVVQI